ncbi:MAG: hypothetical protein U0166_02395 [Acidobacteriota bacterium]
MNQEPASSRLLAFVVATLFSGALAFAAEPTPAPSPAPTKEAGAKTKPAKKKHEHTAAHGGQLGMWKDWHLEVAIPEPGLYKVWLSDAYRQPIKLEGITGTLTVTPAGKPAAELTLTADPAGEYLMAKSDAETGVVETEVRIKGLPEEIFMEFHFEGVGAPPATPPPAMTASGSEPATQPSATQPMTATQSATQPSATQPMTATQPASTPAASKEPETMPKKHEHSAKHGGQLGMVGENHVELAVAKAGEYKVWLSDAYRKPLPLAKATGKVTVTDPAGKATSIDLAIAPTKDCMVANGDPITGTIMVEVTVDGVATETIDTEFQVEVK